MKSTVRQTKQSQNGKRTGQKAGGGLDGKMAQQQNAIHKFVLGTKEIEGKNAEFQYDHGWYSITDIVGEERNEFYRSRNAQEAYMKWNVYIGRKKERPVREDRHHGDGEDREERRRDNRRKDEHRSGDRSADMIQDSEKQSENGNERRSEYSRSRSRNRGERALRQENTERMDVSDNGERTERQNRTDNTKRQARGERTEKQVRTERSDGADKAERTGRKERPNHTQNGRTAGGQGSQGTKMRNAISEGWDARKKDDSKPQRERFRRNRRQKSEKDDE